jgi:hypothetical protein
VREKKAGKYFKLKQTKEIENIQKSLHGPVERGGVFT